MMGGGVGGLENELEMWLSDGAQGSEFNWESKNVHINTQMRKQLDTFNSAIYKPDQWTDESLVMNPSSFNPWD